jgi:hypothetical protein
MGWAEHVACMEAMIIRTILYLQYLRADLKDVGKDGRQIFRYLKAVESNAGVWIGFK